MFNRVIIALFFLSVACVVYAPAAKADFPDVATDHWAYEAVDYLNEEGFVTGYPDGTFKGDRTLTRYEFAMVISRLYDQFLDLIEDAGGSEPGIDTQMILDTLIEEFQPELDEIRELAESNAERIGVLEGTVGEIDGRVEDLTSRVDSIQQPLHFSGDLRLRFEGKYPDSGLQTQRPRFRFRYGFTADINDELTAGARFASGEVGGITSTNRTIGDAFGFDEIVIDRAFLQYKPASIPEFTVWGGKFSPPWKTTLLSWDSDVTVEGLAQQYSVDNFDFYLGELVPTDEGFYLVAQIAAEDIFTEGLDGAITYHYINEDAWTHIMADMISGELKSNFVFGNLESPTDYRAIEAYGKFSFDAGGVPLSIEGNYLQNLEDSVPGAAGWNKAAWAILAIYGKPSEIGDWQVQVEWGRAQANSVLSWLTDADRGSGDQEWWGGNITYRWMRNTDLAITFLTVDRISKDSNYDLLHADVVTKF